MSSVEFQEWHTRAVMLADIYFKDVWRFSVGANYRYNDQWMFRGGIAYDQTPVRDEFRTPRLPDSDRTWLSFGAQYKWSPALKFDVGAIFPACRMRLR